MNSIKKIVLGSVFALTLVLFIATGIANAQTNENSNSILNNNQAPVQGGVRVILPEDEINQTPSQAMETKSQKTVLYGLGAMLLVIVAIVAALSLYPLRHTKRQETHKNTFDDNQEL